jgi:hypothetical protein
MIYIYICKLYIYTHPEVDVHRNFNRTHRFLTFLDISWLYLGHPGWGHMKLQTSDASLVVPEGDERVFFCFTQVAPKDAADFKS